ERGHANKFPATNLDYRNLLLFRGCIRRVERNIEDLSALRYRDRRPVAPVTGQRFLLSGHEVFSLFVQRIDCTLNIYYSFDSRNGVRYHNCTACQVINSCSKGDLSVGEATQKISRGSAKARANGRTFPGRSEADFRTETTLGRGGRGERSHRARRSNLDLRTHLIVKIFCLR